MPDIEKVIKGLEWILENDRFGFGEHWTFDSEPRDDYEQAGYNITRGIELLKEYKALQPLVDELSILIKQFRTK